MRARPCLGVDVGGTFTDLAFYGENGELTCIKVASTPARPGFSTLQGVDELRRLSGCTDAAWAAMSHTHSNTVAVNCLIERTGARLGLLVTAGFRDILEIARLTVPEPARYDSRRPAPLVPRRRVAEVAERVDADGRVVRALDRGSALAAARRLQALGCDILVICFLHSYKNPAHERAARAAIEQDLPGFPVEISADVWPQAREFERATLALVNAHIRPAVERQVELLVNGMAERGVRTPARGSRSNGGMELLATMSERPVTALLSGPAAGVAGAAAAAARTAEEPSVRAIRLRGREVTARVFTRAGIAADSRIDGPAIIEQMDTTTLVPDGWTLTLADNGAMIVTRDSAR